MTADSLFALDPATTGVTVSDSAGGGAGRGGSPDGSQGPLVVVQQPRNTAPPRPAPQRSQGNTDNSLRNGYAAISHSVSGETAAIGAGFLLGGPIGAVIGGAALPAAAAVVMWRARRREHDQNTNRADRNNPSSSGPGTRNGGPGGGGRNQGDGRGNTNSTPNTPKTGNGNGSASGSGANRKPKIKDPVADKLNKLGKGFADKLKNRGKTDKAPKNKRTDTGKNTGPGAGGKGSADPKSPKQSKSTNPAKANKDRGWLKNRGPQPDSPKPWASRDTKPKKHRKDKNPTNGDATSSTARDGLTPKNPKGPSGGTGHSAGADDVIDAELIDDDLPPKPTNPPADIIDGEVIDEDRIALVRAKREKKKRRAVQAAAKKAGEQAARTGTQGDPAHVRAHIIRQGNHHIDVQIHHENHLIALSEAAEQTRSTPVDYPAIQAAPTGTRTAGVAIARQIDVRGTTAYAILRAMADQLAHGLHSDDDADMGDHIIELTGIPNMCKNLSVAVQEAGQALAKTAPLHPTVIKHLNNAAVAARTAGVMAENIMVVFVQAHREDIIRILDPRLGEERWNIRNAPGTLDAAKLRAAIASAHSTRLALPGGSTGGGQGGSKLVPASDGSTRKLIDLMKNFKRGHMVNVLSEVAGSAAGVDAVSVSITKLYKRMQTTWPTENVVDETVARTAGQVRRVSVELHKAIKAAQKIHDRELRLNSTGRAGKGAYAERKWDVAGRPAASN
ncbi:hypothetical protein ACFUJX_19970 [Streptomyces rubiginosohelvolus]|uniref:hypothetical protein n=1 Tax=Streptomyces rubiginosohelvolus TaxID=67362 RepID=UPI003631945F